MSTNFILVKLLKDLDFLEIIENFRKISFLVKIFDKSLFYSKSLK